MKKYLWLLLFLVFLVPSQADAQNKAWGASCLTGAAACLDGINGASIAAGDIGLVVVDESGIPTLYVYRVYESEEEESSPNIIAPDNNAGDKRWHLVRAVATGLTTGSTTGVRISGSNGTITFLGLGDGQDEDLKLDLNTTSNTAIWSSSTSVDTWSFSAINTVTTGTISGKIPTVVNSDTNSYSVTEAQARAGTFFLTTNAATTTYVLPSAEAGMSACFKMGQGNAQILRIDTDGTDYIVKSTGARTSAAGDYYGATSSATNQICVVAFDATDWYVTSEVGTWTEE